MKRIIPMFFPVIILFSWTSTLRPQTQDGEAVSLSDSIGTEIDEVEAQAYHLFPDIKGFKSARLFRLTPSKYRLDYVCEGTRRLRHKSRTVSAGAVELTRFHLKLTEEYQRIRYSRPFDHNVRAEAVYELALKYASQARYDIASMLFSDLLSDYPQSDQAKRAMEMKIKAERLWKTKKALFWKGSLLDQTGRTNLLIFSGYYGVWLGLATPISLGAESPQAYAAGLLLGGPLSVLIAHNWTKEANISDGRATMIALGGHLGTWQGIGWAVIADQDGEDVVGIGELGGLAGIAAATLLTSKTDFSTGHAGLTSSGLQWGAWFGLVAGVMADHEGNDLLRDMLIGSDVLILGTGVAAKDVRMSKSRVRLINLAGVIGTVFGFGVDLFLEVDEASTALAIAGLGSVAGLAAGTELTKNYDAGKELSVLDRDGSHLRYSSMQEEKTWSVAPKFALQKDSYDNELTPYFSFEFSF